MKKENFFCITLLGVVFAGLFGAIYLRPEYFSAMKCFSYYFMVIVYVFLPMGLDITEDRNLLIYCLLALIGVVVGILLGIDYWYLPLAATVLPFIYQLLRSKREEKKWNIAQLGSNIFYLTLLSYVCCLAMEGMKRGWEYFVIY